MIGSDSGLIAKEHGPRREGLPALGPQGLYTIGYEGLALHVFLEKLTHAGVVVLCDVRRNAFSMKRGFKKGQLAHACESVGIRYEHLPELGIASLERKDLNTQADRDALFGRYVMFTLASTRPAQERIVDLIATHGRVAIMCFEADPSTCHRSHLASALSALRPEPFSVHHLCAS